MIYIFVGPTLSSSEARPVLDAIYLPPAMQGDVYRAARRKPQMIGIIDGYFDTVPSVWHKEILWAMSQGIHVFGSASMGALRAAELAAFGMEGIGTIFEAYRRGALEDDDEVAVTHAPAEEGYHARSVAMVNIRATLAAAQAQRVISSATHDALLQIAKHLFYPERVYPRLLNDGAAIGLSHAELDVLRGWLPQEQVDQKRADALAMLRVMHTRHAMGLQPKKVSYHFEHTEFWDQVCQNEVDSGQDSLALDGLLDEARLDVAIYREAVHSATTRKLAKWLASQEGRSVPEERLVEVTEQFRFERGLQDKDAMARWLAAHDLDANQFLRLMQDEVFLRWARSRTAPDLEARVIEQLHLADYYPQLRARARHKQDMLQSAGLLEPSLEDAGLTRVELLEWYFARRGGARVPTDLAHYAIHAGFHDEQLFIRALLREYYYLQIIGSESRGNQNVFRARQVATAALGRNP